MLLMDGVKEVVKGTADVYNKINGFEMAKNDIKEVRRIHTINEHYEGKTLPMGVPFRKHTFHLNGERVEGVFPKFDSEFTCRMPKNMWKSSDYSQFSFCNKMLQGKIGRDPEFAKKFNSRQLEQIKNGEPRISGFTWHHNEIPGKMELVDRNMHDIVKHTGGKSLWGGGAGMR